ncbi:MAG TPA: hypothetical protein VJT31_12880 [Rugosimonospora sp.]|nr:hypothetical protein [Rugosimonospora sp.]
MGERGLSRSGSDESVDQAGGFHGVAGMAEVVALGVGTRHLLGDLALPVALDADGDDTDPECPADPCHRVANDASVGSSSIKD